VEKNPTYNPCVEKKGGRNLRGEKNKVVAAPGQLQRNVREGRERLTAPEKWRIASARGVGEAKAGKEGGAMPSLYKKGVRVCANGDSAKGK